MPEELTTRRDLPLLREDGPEGRQADESPEDRRTWALEVLVELAD